MRKSRKHLVWVLGLALALGVSGVAYGDASQSIEFSMSPSKVDKKKFKKNGTLFVRVATTGTPNNPPPTFGVDTSQSDIDFPKDFKFTTKGLPECDPATIQNTTPDQALATCPDGSNVGDGAAVAHTFIGTDLPVTVTAFNGTKQNGNPTLLLHSYVPAPPAPLPITQVLVGELIDSPKAGFGERLDVPVPTLASGSAVLSEFETTVGKKYKPKGGKKKKKRFYVSARCKSSDKTWNVSSDWQYRNNTPINDVSASQPCKVKK